MWKTRNYWTEALIPSSTEVFMGNFKVGNTVELKSGGPSMTIANIHEHNGVSVALCHWFNGGAPQQNNYPLTSLREYRESAGNPVTRESADRKM
jgi:uncharacterized protein YodC (DUF2158 family)